MTKLLIIFAVMCLIVSVWRQRKVRSTLYSKKQVDALLMALREEQDRALGHFERPTSTRVVSHKTYSATPAVFMSNTFQREVLADLEGKKNRTLTLKTKGASRLSAQGFKAQGFKCEEVSIKAHGSQDLISQQIQSAMRAVPFNVSMTGVTYDDQWSHTFEITIEEPTVEMVGPVVVKEFEVIYLKPGEEPPVRQAVRVEEDLEDKIRAAVEVELDTRKARVMQSASKER